MHNSLFDSEPVKFQFNCSMTNGVPKIEHVGKAHGNTRKELLPLPSISDQHLRARVVIECYTRTAAWFLAAAAYQKYLRSR